MKIVKMHKGSREAFDDFLAQRLNEVEVDNDTADKYFADMNLPVSVMPDAKISFLSKHKNKLWLLSLLCIASISTYVMVNNRKIKLPETESAINKSVLENREGENKKNSILNENTFNNKEEAIKIDSKHISTNSTGIETNAKLLQSKVLPKIKKKESNSLFKHKSIETKITNTTSASYLDTATVAHTTNQISIDKKSISTSAPAVIKTSLHIEKKTANSDSLYIIW
jgi:hypothetical protein